ncbi:hypothetical protein GC194_12190 [bacterium]|nr:hypothetical protein [bacterium]
MGIVIKSLNDKELLNEEVAIPQPEEIRLSYTVTPGYVGELLPLQVGCIFSNGRVGTTTTYTDITWQMFTLTCRGDTLDPHFLFFPYYVDSPEFLQFTATFNGDTSVNHSLFLNCFYSDTLTFDFSGADGLPGKNGANGHDELAYYRNGRWGQNGEDGLHGTNLNVVLIPLQAEEGEKEMLKILFISDTFHHVLLINPDKALIRINLSGGDGGKGGDGGRGANGSENAENSKMARGGDGGSGGNGGQGGTGGEMYLITNAAGKSYAHLVQVVNSGGHGGAPGAGGKGGQTYVRVNAGFFEKMVNGSNGENGIPGKAGMDGYDGVRPVLWLVDDSELLQLLQESEGW